MRMVPDSWCISGWISNAAASFTSDAKLELAQALHQVVSAPTVEYMRYDGDLIKYVSFVHNFETCLKKDNPDNSKRLQLLIQHCYGKAKDAIESCVNLPVDEGYHVAKSNLCENFGLLCIIAKAHIRKLESLPPPEASRWSKFTCICSLFKCSQ